MGIGQDWTGNVARATVAMLLGWVAASTATAATPAPGYTDEVYVGGLSQPTAIAFLPDGRLLVLEKGGGVRLAENPPVAPGSSSAGSIGVCSDSEMGLLGVAVDPAFGTNGRLFFYRTENAGGCGSATGRSNEVVSTTLTSGQIGALTTLLTGIRTDGGNHDGGTLRIGPDGKLYVSVGDTGVGDGGGPGSSSNPYSADLNALEGKVLRLNLDGSVPNDNPYAGQVGKRGEIFASGLRNPFRIGFDPFSGRLWAADVGQSTVEEVDIVSSGGDYGWPQCEGTQPTGCPAIGATGAPVYEYDRSGVSASITGGAFVLGGAQAGRYFFGDYVFDTIWALDVDANRTGVVGAAETVVTDAAGPVDFAFGPDGALYYVAINTGEVHRLSHAGFGVGSSTTTIPASSSTTTTAPTSSTTTSTVPGACLAAPTFVCMESALDTLATLTASVPDVRKFDDKLRASVAAAATGVFTAEASEPNLARRLLRR